MKHASLFSGIGGFDLAAQWMGWENIFQVEIDGFCQKVLAKNFPTVKRYGDIKEFDGTPYRGTIDIITGGFPCQPYSLAGKRKGKEDSRHLWPEMLRVIREVKPSYVVGENVSGLTNWSGGLVFEEVHSDLEDEGYDVQTVLLPAAGVGAWHRRERVWFISHTNNQGLPIIRQQEGVFKEAWETLQSIERGDGMESYLRSSISGNVESVLCRAGHGIPDRVDRIKALGNAVVPQVVYEIFKAIDLCSKSVTNVK